MSRTAWDNGMRCRSDGGATVQFEAVLGGIAAPAPRQRSEVGEPQLQGHARGGEVLLAQCRRDSLRLAAQGRRESTRIPAIARKGLLGADRSRQRIGGHGTCVSSERQIRQLLPMLAEAPSQDLSREGLELADRLDSEGVQLSGHHPAHPPQPLDGEWGQEHGLLAGGHDHEPVRLAEIGCHLGHELVRGRGPAEAVRPVSARIRALIWRTASAASPKSAAVPVRSTKASSMETCSTSGEKASRMSMICRETRWYFSMSTGRNSA